MSAAEIGVGPSLRVGSTEPSLVTKVACAGGITVTGIAAYQAVKVAYGSTLRAVSICPAVPLVAKAAFKYLPTVDASSLEISAIDCIPYVKFAGCCIVAAVALTCITVQIARIWPRPRVEGQFSPNPELTVSLMKPYTPKSPAHANPKRDAVAAAPAATPSSGLMGAVAAGAAAVAAAAKKQ